MNASRVPAPVSSALLCITLLAVGCSSGLDLSQPASQLDFGVEAAERDLWREAKFRFEKAVEMNPGDAMARNNLAVAYEGAGEFEKAREAYVAALRIDQSNQYIQKNYSRFMEFYSRNRKREAEAIQTGIDEPASDAAGEPSTVSLPGPPVTAAPPGEEPVMPVSDTPPPGSEPPATPAESPASPPKPNGVAP